MDTRPVRSGEDRVGLVTHPDLSAYDFGPHHPLRPERIVLGLDLLETSHLWDPAAEALEAAAAPDEILHAVHAPEYVAAVRAAGSRTLSADRRARFGLASSDNPPFEKMHYAASLVAGGAWAATQSVMSGSQVHAFHPAGGLHHALRSRAAGFCIYNDPAIAAAIAVQQFGARVAYLDFDCHHGDGVQWLFYENPDVLTISFHESGEYLFPGTGSIDEIGTGAGQGFSVNVPFLPYTQDDSWLHAIEVVIPELVRRFSPDLLLTVHGCDTHLWDPLTHLTLTTRALVAQSRIAHEMAHQYADGRWIAFGSGGYEWRRVVPRSWSIVWAEMSDRTLPERIPDVWLNRWKSPLSEPLPETFLDTFSMPALQSSSGITDANEQILAGVRTMHAL